MLPACRDAATPTPGPVPTLAATAAPLTELSPTPSLPTQAPVQTVEPSAVPVATSRQHSPDFDLTDTVWEWERRTDNGGLGVLIRVPEPEKYGLLFNKDGTSAPPLTVTVPAEITPLMV